MDGAYVGWEAEFFGSMLWEREIAEITKWEYWNRINAGYLSQM